MLKYTNLAHDGNGICEHKLIQSQQKTLEQSYELFLGSPLKQYSCMATGLLLNMPNTFLRPRSWLSRLCEGDIHGRGQREKLSIESFYFVD